MNIFVGNISYSLSENELASAFEAYGTVESVKLITDRDTGRPKGFGFIEMPNDDEARKAIEELDGQEVGGRPLRVNEAQPPKPRSRF